jgi:hypothetical protein
MILVVGVLEISSIKRRSTSSLEKIDIYPEKLNKTLVDQRIVAH